MQVGERDVALLGGLVVQDGVALREGAAAGVLAAQAHREALAQQRAERQVLGGRPVDVGAALDALAALADDPLELAVQVHRLGHRGHRQPDLADQLERHRGAAALVLLGRPGQAGPGALQPVGLVHLVAGRGLVRRAHPLLEGVVKGLRVLLADHPLLDQALGVDLARGRVLRDRAVHQRLGEARLVAFVVAVAAIAPQIDHHVLLELLAELGGEPRHVHHGFGIVAVDVEDRRLDAARTSEG